MSSSENESETRVTDWGATQDSVHLVASETPSEVTELICQGDFPVLRIRLRAESFAVPNLVCVRNCRGLT